MSNTEAESSYTILFPIVDLDRAIVDIVPQMTTPPKWPAFNAIRHLNRAWQLRELDPQMAMFRSITAEEEAATAVFLSLKRRGYDGADKLNQRNHVQKNAVIPFFDAITRVITKVGDQMPLARIYVDKKENPPLLKICFKHKYAMSEEPVWARPEPPLHFSILSGPEGGEMQKEDFAHGVDEIVTDANVKNITDYLGERANVRNRILYARSNGYPSIDDDVGKILQSYQSHVFIILKMYLFIDPYPTRQLFVQQALYAFLKTLNLLPNYFEF